MPWYAAAANDSARQLDIVGAPRSARAYAPGQERAPQALRAAGSLALLEGREHRRQRSRRRARLPLRIDRENPRAVNADAAVDIARAVADQLAESLAVGSAILVLGGDCTLELGTVAGATRKTPDTGLVYIDYDTDMNTPPSYFTTAMDVKNSARSGASASAVTPWVWPSRVRRCALGIVDALTNHEIAARMFMSRRTVEANLSRAYQKLAVRSRTEVARRLPRGDPADT